MGDRSSSVGIVQHSNLTVPCDECSQVPAKEHKRPGGGGGWRQLNYPGGQCVGKTGPGLDPDPPALDPVTHEWSTGLAASLCTAARAPCPGLCLGQKESPASVTSARSLLPPPKYHLDAQQCCLQLRGKS